MKPCADAAQDVFERPVVVLGAGQGAKVVSGELAAKSAALIERRRYSRPRSRSHKGADSAAAEFRPYLAHARRKGFGAGKRLIDLVAATSLLVLLTPLLALTAAAIRLDSEGPILYRQKRVGAGGRIFEIFKFRSMRVDAEKDGPRWAAPKDDRVTRVGCFIRKTRLDEVPQVINVLRGEMSFVGPRPERPEFVSVLEREIPHYHFRHEVKPGITGWAQVRYVYAASVEDARIKQEYDLEYIRNLALWRDLFIIALTVKVVLFGLGSR